MTTAHSIIDTKCFSIYKMSISVSEVRMILFVNKTSCNIFYCGKNVLKWLKITKSIMDGLTIWCLTNES